MSFQIEPALNLSISYPLLDPSTARLYIGDNVTIKYSIHHADTSLQAAKDVELKLSTQHMVLMSGDFLQLNSTCYRIILAATSIVGSRYPESSDNLFTR